MVHYDAVAAVAADVGDGNLHVVDRVDDAGVDGAVVGGASVAVDVGAEVDADYVGERP